MEHFACSEAIWFLAWKPLSISWLHLGMYLFWFVLGSALYEQLSVFDKTRLFTHCHHLYCLYRACCPGFSSLVCVPQTWYENLTHLGSAMSLDQQRSVFCSDESLSHQAAPQMARSHCLETDCPYTDIFSATSLSFAVHVTECHTAMWEHCFPTKAKQRVGTNPQTIQQPMRFYSFFFLDFILNIYSPTTYPPIPWLPGIMPIETPTFFWFILIYEVLTFWAREREHKNASGFVLSFKHFGPILHLYGVEIDAGKILLLRIVSTWVFLKCGFWPKLVK